MWRKFFKKYSDVFTIFACLEICGIALAVLGFMVNEGIAALKWLGYYTLGCFVGTICILFLVAVAIKHKKI